MNELTASLDIKWTDIEDICIELDCEGNNGVMDPKKALAMETFYLPTITLQTFTYINNKKFLEETGAYTGSNYLYNTAFIVLETLQVALNGVAVGVMNKSQNWYILLIWFSNVVI